MFNISYFMCSYHRNIGYGLQNTMARVGAIIGPQLVTVVRLLNRVHNLNISELIGHLKLNADSSLSVHMLCILKKYLFLFNQNSRCSYSRRKAKKHKAVFTYDLKWSNSVKYL